VACRAVPDDRFSKKGISAHQVHRMLGISYKSTWFMMHRLREAMRTGGLEPLGGAGKVVEADETYFGKPTKNAFRRIAASRARTTAVQEQPRRSSRLSSAAVRCAHSMPPLRTNTP
jgi:molybdenum-dependent DNA-binding transcriptional regulator ModE